MKTGIARIVFLASVLTLMSAPLPSLAGPAEDEAQAEAEFERGNLLGAMRLWRTAAEAGLPKAQAHLGDMLDKAEEDEEAVAWYRKSAAQGNADGEFGLGQMYAKGEGVKRDFEQARLYVLRAAEKNHLNAILKMREAYRMGSLGLPKDAQKSAEWDARAKELAVQPAKAEPVPKGPAVQVVK